MQVIFEDFLKKDFSSRAEKSVFVQYCDLNRKNYIKFAIKSLPIHQILTRICA